MTKQRIMGMNRDELVWYAYDLARSDMSIACFESDEETMEHTASADDETLREYLLDSIDYVDDSESTIYYKDIAIHHSMDGWYMFNGHRFALLESVVKYIDQVESEV